jgi:general secretion pathway protein G
MEMVNTAKVVAAMGDIRQIQFEIEGYHSSAGTYPSSLEEASIVNLLDPWDRPYQYLLISDADTKGKGGKSGSGKVRKDKNLHPLNSDYDLYSMGRDGLSVAPLTAKVSHDDVIRANNGGFIGLAQNY